MLAALLCNLPAELLPSGGVPRGFEDEKADRYLKTLRDEHFGRQEAKRNLPEEMATKPTQMVYKVPMLPEINEIKLPGKTAMTGDMDDDTLALLLIIAEL